MQMTIENIKTDWRKVDYRCESLNQIIKGLDSSILFLQTKIKEVHWYDGDWFLEETEPIYGLAFIAFQNYINGSIKDFFGNINKAQYYKVKTNLNTFDRSSIELIISLANYSKHKDDNELHKGTKDILESFKLNDFDRIENSPIFTDLTILSVNWKLSEVFEIVIDWRKKLFLLYNAYKA